MCLVAFEYFEFLLIEQYNVLLIICSHLNE
nr:MAG TPA: hypothetical protein [Bacteriophage sp.]